MTEILHASFVAIRVTGFWRGALLEGPSANGKSDLAFRCLSAGFSLVADDRVVAFASQGSLWGRAPDALAGLIEARGVGILAVTPLPFAHIGLAVDLVTTPDQVERMPEAHSRTILDVPLPAVRLWPHEAAAPAKLAALLQCGNVDQLRHLGA